MTWRRTPPLHSGSFFHHVFACKNSPIGARDIVAPGKGAVRWCDTLKGWWYGYELSSAINPTSPFRSKHLARFSDWPGRSECYRYSWFAWIFNREGHLFQPFLVKFYKIIMSIPRARGYYTEWCKKIGTKESIQGMVPDRPSVSVPVWWQVGIALVLQSVQQIQVS